MFGNLFSNSRKLMQEKFGVTPLLGSATYNQTDHLWLWEDNSGEVAQILCNGGSQQSLYFFRGYLDISEKNIENKGKPLIDVAWMGVGESSDC